jgi:hypothetical protein
MPLSARAPLLCLIFQLCVLPFHLTEARAEESLRWEDSSGRTFYGSKPPAGAKNITAVNPKTYSKYSSERLLKGYKKERSNPTTLAETNIPVEIPPEEPPTTEDKIPDAGKEEGQR